ncbi:MAG: hypothetical protein EDM03_09025 [Porphyrobacter sp. IPPAS B-1204]|nr:MAG: hypothetical protein EDM03_09025 [Porphyrobacter sp. IPPAS B-1204]
MSKMIDKGNDASAEGRIKAMPQGIFVLGMHRSGTSACTRVLNLLGCALSDELLGAGEGNETGHWEPVRAIALNDEILASAGSSHEDWGPINADWRNSAIRSTMVQRVSEVIADHAKLGPLFAIKDPRICRLADVWLEAAADAEIEPLIVLMLRNPVEVAASLESRDLMANGYSDLLWLRHVLDAEFFSRGQKRAICRYDELMTNWQTMVAKIKTGLGVSFPRNSPKVHREISQFLTPAQHHHRSDIAELIGNPAYPHWLRKTFQIMFDWSEKGENANDYPILDELRSELDRAHGAFAQLLLTPNVTGSVGAGGNLRWELSALREEAERKDESLRHATKEVEELRASSALKEAELAERLQVEATQARNLESEIERLNAELASRTTSEAEAVALRAELSGRNNELASLQSTLNQTQADISAEQELRADTENRLAETSRELHEQQQRNSQLMDQITIAQNELSQRREELAGLNDQLVDAEQMRLRAEALEAELSERTTALANAQLALDSVHAEVNAERENRAKAEALQAEAEHNLDAQQSANSELASQVTIAQSEVAQRDEELAKLQNQLDEAERELQEQQLQSAEMVGQIAILQSTLIQRQEELAQLLAQFRETDALRLRAELEGEREREQRLALEQAIAAANNEIAALQQQWAHGQAAANQQVEARAAELAHVTLMLKAQEEATEQAVAEASTSRAEAHRLSEQVVQLTNAANHAQEAHTTSERKLAARFDELARLTANLLEASRRSEASDTESKWLRDIRKLEEGFPTWWSIMPDSWRQPRIHRRYWRAGLFDAAAYLSLYPDVAAQGMDPVRHYILHGMAEGRTRPVPF